MSIVNGKNVRFLIYNNGRYHLYACAMSCTLNISTTSIETSVTGSGDWASNEVQKHSWTGSFDGVVNLDPDDQLDLMNLRALQFAKTKLLIRYESIDEDGREYAEEGEGFIVNSSNTGDINNVSTFNIEILGTGPITQSYTPITPPVLVSYKVYTANLTQSGTDAPVATIFENTLSGIPVWSRLTDGQYLMTLTGEFLAAKTFVTVVVSCVLSRNDWIMDAHFNFYNISRISDDKMVINTFTHSMGEVTANADDILFNYPFELRVYY